MLTIHHPLTPINPTFRNQPAPTTRFGAGRDDSRRLDTFESSRQESLPQPKKDKGKGLPPELVLQRKMMSLRQNALDVCNWLRANLEDRAVPLSPDATLLLADVLKDDDQTRKENIDSVFDRRSLAEGKKILEQKKQTALKSIVSFPSLSTAVAVKDSPELTMGNTKALLFDVAEKCNEYLHPRQWLERIENA